MRRYFSKKQKLILLLLAGSKCTKCGCRLSLGWHGDHIIPFSVGGQTTIRNGAALCPKCNLKKGNKLEFEAT